MSFDLHPTRFTPRQAEQITGITMVRQRDLRRHGYLPQHEGHARFTAIDLAQMMVLSSMMQRGIAPSTAAGLAEISAVGIVQVALSSPDVWEGMDDAEWTYPGEQMPEDKAQWLARVFSNFQAAAGDNRWRVTPGRFLIIWANGREFWSPSVDHEIEEMEQDDPRLAGPITVLDLHALADQLVRRAQLPLARVVPG